MGFLEGTKTFFTGKTTQERKVEAEYSRRIKKEVMSAEMEERRLQNIRLAKESIRIKADAKLRTLKERSMPQRQNRSEYMTYGSPFGQPRFARKVKVVTKTGKVKKRVAVPSYSIREQVKPGRYDVLGW